MGVQKFSRLLQTFLYGVQSTIPLLCDLDSFGAELVVQIIIQKF